MPSLIRTAGGNYDEMAHTRFDRPGTPWTCVPLGGLVGLDRKHARSGWGQAISAHMTTATVTPTATTTMAISAGLRSVGRNGLNPIS